MATSANPTRDDFAAMLDEQLGGADDGGFEGRVVKGTVTSIENGMAHIDVGLKSEGRVDLKEFMRGEDEHGLEVGSEVEVFVDRIENADGEAMLSRDRARREAAWDKLESEFGEGKRVEGRIFGRVKGGFTVDLDGAVAFLPGSQVDIRPVRDVTPLMDMAQPFQILKMDRRRGNIVVSRRAVLEETRAEQRSELIDKLAEGQVIDGVVKNITDYGAFVDLGGIDGLQELLCQIFITAGVHVDRDQVVGREVLQHVKPEHGNLGEDLPLEGDGSVQHPVKGRDAVGGDEDAALVHAIHIADLALFVLGFPLGEFGLHEAVVELGLEPCVRDLGVSQFGLRNVLFPVGERLLEVVSPVEAGTTAGRQLARRDGDGGYMVLVQTDDLVGDRERLDTLGVRVVLEASMPGRHSYGL